jgi:hypothetical protein
MCSKRTVLNLRLVMQRSYELDSFHHERSRHRTALDEFEHTLAQSYHALRKKVPPEVEDGLRR